MSGSPARRAYGNGTEDDSMPMMSDVVSTDYRLLQIDRRGGGVVSA